MIRCKIKNYKTFLGIIHFDSNVNETISLDSKEEKMLVELFPNKWEYFESPKIYPNFEISAKLSGKPIIEKEKSVLDELKETVEFIDFEQLKELIKSQFPQLKVDKRIKDKQKLLDFVINELSK